MNGYLAHARLGWLVTVGLLLFAAGARGADPAPGTTPAGPGAPPINFILIFTDDQGYNDLGCYGSPLIKTPRIDQMAAEGMRFTDFYDAAPLCTSSRAALLTGCYSQRVSMAVGKLAPWQKTKSINVWYPDSPYGLKPEEVTIAEVLKARGYATGMVGKWHVGDNEAFLPTKQGFDSYFGIPYSNDMQPRVFLRQTEVVERDVDVNTITDRYTEEAKSFIRAHRDGPFFLYLAHNMPHTPLGVSERFRGKSERGLYGDVIMALDDSTGQILDLLKELKIDDRTLVVFTSDNGPWHVRGEDGGSATPLRAGKGTTYDGGMRVPCIARLPGVIPAGSVCREPAVTFDLMPTFANLAGAKMPSDRIIDGRDISPLLRCEPGAKSPHEAIYFYSGLNLNAVRSGKWKLKLETTLQDETFYGKYEDPTAPIPERLYNLQTDPGEQKSVLKDHPDVASRLRALAEQARQDLGDARTHRTGRNIRPLGVSDDPRLNKQAR